MNKNIPIIESKGLNEDGVITAKTIFESRNIEKLPKYIDTAVILFDPSPSDMILKDCTLLFDFVAAASVLKQYIYKDKIVVAFSPLGGPASGGLIEELIAFGVKRFIACGSSGLIGHFDTERFLVVTKAIRDEGLSYHYLEPSIYVETDQELNELIKNELDKKSIKYDKGITWTTDAFYKETKERIEIRKNQGAIAVEMECASMAAVCKFRKLSFSQLLYFSDIVNHEGWSNFLDSRGSIKEKINQIIIDVACKI